MPEPAPPADFPGAQYIDGTGCVFVRDKDGWTARTDKQGVPICGFPPSLPAQAAAIPHVAPPSPEEVLTGLMAQGLRSGDLVMDEPAKPLPPPSVDPAQAVLDKTLQEQVAAEARLRAAMAGQANDLLCERLGYRPASGKTPPIGADVTQGLCPGMVPPDTGPLLVRLSKGEPVTEAVAAEAPAAVVRTDLKPVPLAQPNPKAKPASVVARRPATVKVPEKRSVEMIPANARYVEIGVYTDPGNAMAALRRLSGMGFRTAQRDQKLEERIGKAILAGPFADRQALVSALARLRQDGYPRAVAR